MIKTGLVVPEIWLDKIKTLGGGGGRVFIWYYTVYYTPDIRLPQCEIELGHGECLALCVCE